MIRDSYIGVIETAVGQQENFCVVLVHSVKQRRQAIVPDDVVFDVLDGQLFQVSVSVDEIDSVANILEDCFE